MLQLLLLVGFEQSANLHGKKSNVNQKTWNMVNWSNTKRMRTGSQRKIFLGGTKIDAGPPKLSEALTDKLKKVFTQIWSLDPGPGTMFPLNPPLVGPRCGFAQRGASSPKRSVIVATGGHTPLTDACAPHLGLLKILFLEHYSMTTQHTMMEKECLHSKIIFL